jgi:hypothetical protein
VAVNQEHLAREIAELMGMMQGAMQECQTSLDELIHLQKSQAYEIQEKVSHAVTLLQYAENTSEQMLEAQRKALNFISQRWADGMLEKAQEAGQAQARLFGKSVAQEAVKDVQKALSEANSQVMDSVRQLKDATHYYSLYRLAYSVIFITCMTALVFATIYFSLPSMEKIQENRDEIARQEATLATLEKKGGRIELSVCGSKRRLCARVESRDTYGKDYMILRVVK